MSGPVEDRMAGEVVLEARGLVRRFGGLLAVAGVSFVLHDREILGLIGPNGAGKSTTFDLISGFRRPQAGSLTLFGRTVTGRGPRAISRHGLVRTFQHESLIRDMTVHDNILVGALASVRGREARDAQVRRTAAAVGLSDVLEERAGRLPHGRQRLLSIAIALASRPRILCLDEPLTGLNAVEVAATLDIIRGIRETHGTAILFVEHNIRAVMSLCHRIVVLNRGEVLAEGTPEAVSRAPAVIEAYLGAPA